MSALAGLNICIGACLTETMGNMSKLIKAHGGVSTLSLSKQTTHLITTADKVNSDLKVKRAKENGTHVVSEQFIFDSIRDGKKADESKYSLAQQDQGQAGYASGSSGKLDNFFEYEANFVTEAELSKLKQREDEQRDASQQAKEAARKAASTTAGYSHTAALFAQASQSGSLGSGYAITFSSASSTEASSAASAPTGVPAASNVVKRQPLTKPTGPVVKVKAFRDTATDKPKFPATFDIEYYNTLQWTDLKENHNKYYCIELHTAKSGGKEYFRIYTHYGRTDDLATKADSGAKENRFYDSLKDAENAYYALIEEKTITKGYRKVDLLFSNIGSQKLRELTAAKASASEAAEAPAPTSTSSVTFESTAANKKLDLQPAVQELVQYIFEEANKVLNSTLGPAKITSKGIETPLGVVTTTQIDLGEKILQQLYDIFKSNDESPKAKEEMLNLTNQFYTLIPHVVGRSREGLASKVITSMQAFEEKQELLQLMRDMLRVTAEGKSLHASEIDMKYLSLHAQILEISSHSGEFADTAKFIKQSQVGADNIVIDRIFSVTREKERDAFEANPVKHNKQLLYHGSRISNYVGLLSRGVLMPKLVVAMGGKRRDAGLLGNGIYFGDSVTTSAQYTTAGTRGTRLMLLNNVALGNVKDYTKVMFGLTEPPAGFHSVHGVRAVPGLASEFKDDEYVVFNTNQQHQQYLLEFHYKAEPTPAPIVVQSKPAAAPVSAASPLSTPSSDISTAAPTTPSSMSSSFELLKDWPSTKPAEPKKEEKPKFGAKWKYLSRPAEPTTSANSSDSSSSTSSWPSGNSSTSTSTTSKFSFGLGSKSAFGTSSVLTKSQPGSKFGAKTSTSTKTATSAAATTKSTTIDNTATGSTFTPTPASSTFSLSAAASLVADDNSMVVPEAQRQAAKRTFNAIGATGPLTQADDQLGPRGSTFKRHSSKAEPNVSVLLEDSEDSALFAPSSKKAKLRASDADHSSNTLTSSGTNNLTSSSTSNLTASRPLRLSGGGTAPTGLLQPADKAEAIRASTAQFKTNGGSNMARSKLQALIGKENEKIKHKEDELRETFIKDRSNYALNDMHVHLVDVFKTRDQTWKQQHETVEEAAIPKLLMKHQLRVKEGESAIVSAETFKNNFAELTNNVFKDMKDWSNIFIAGGSVLGALLNIQDRSAFQDTDVDMFLYGLTEEQATQKLQDIFFVVQAATKATCQIIRTKHAVTILGQHPTRHVQVVLRIYKSPSEVLMGFDVDSCCVGFDGTTVWALPRARRAICKRYNLVDMSRRSLSYEARLYKYSKRGFAVAVPGLQRFLIEPTLYTKRPSEVHGLAKLILFDHDTNTRLRAKFEPWRPAKQRYQIYSHDDFSDHTINEFETMVLLQQAQRDHETTHVSNEKQTPPDYSAFFIPWGPQWPVSKIMKHIEFRDKKHFFSTFYSTGQKPKHLYFDTMDGVLKGRISWEKPTDAPAVAAGPASTPVAPAPAPATAAVAVTATESTLRASSKTNELISRPTTPLLGTSTSSVGSDASSASSLLGNVDRSATLRDYYGVEGALRWVTENPGTQLLTGSFHPIDDESWYQHAYCESAEVELTQIIADSIYGNKLATLQQLVRKNKAVDLNQKDHFPRGKSPLNHACLFGELQLARHLTDRGVNVEAIDPDTGLSPIHYAAYSGNAMLVELLMQKGANPNLKSRDQQWTALHVAAFYNNSEAVKVLLFSTSPEVDKAAEDIYKRTPAFLAAMTGALESLKVLHSNGAKLEVSDKFGATLLQVAAQHSQEAICLYVTQALKVSMPAVLAKPQPELLSADQKRPISDFVPASLVGEELVHKDAAGQTLLHYAVKYCQPNLLRRILHADIYPPSPNQRTLKVVDLNAENTFGQSALAYVQLLLSSFGPATGSPTTTSTSQTKGDLAILGMPDPDARSKLALMRELLINAGARMPPLAYYKEIPILKDDTLYNLMAATATYANEVVRQEQAQAEAREQEERDAEVKAQQAAVTARKKRAAPDSPSSPPPFTIGATSPPSPRRSSGKKTTKPWRQPLSPERIITTNAEPTTTFSLVTPVTPVPQSPAVRPVSAITSTPQLAFAGSAVPLSAFGGSTLVSSGSIGPQAGSTFTGSISMPSSVEIPVSLQGALKPSSSRKTVQRTTTGATDVAGMLVAVIEMHKAQHIDGNQKTKLKTLALTKDRRLIAAYKAFSVDHDVTEFVDTVRLLC